MGLTFYADERSNRKRPLRGDFDEHGRVLDMTESMPFREPWFRPDPDRARSLEIEAATEIGPEHQLHGHLLTATAACSGCDRVVFRLEDESWAVVELTWRSTKPETSACPTSERYGSYLAVEQGMDLHEH